MCLVVPHMNPYFPINPNFVDRIFLPCIDFIGIIHPQSKLL